jgi:hypothetical protein
MLSPQKKAPDNNVKMDDKQIEQKSYQFMCAKSAIKEEDEKVEVESNASVGNTEALAN